MRILIAVDKFKGSLGADEVAQSISKGIAKSNPKLHVNIHPLADGGDGTLAILKKKLSLKTISCKTVDPLGRPINSYYCSDDHTAFIELSTSSGIALLSDNLVPMKSNTEGTGLLIVDAIRRNHQQIILAIGGSCSTDAGTGILRAIGYRFINSKGTEITPIGEHLSDIAMIITPENPVQIPITILTDVRNTLCGPEGSAHIFAPQKGANPSQVAELDRGLKHFAGLTKEITGIEIITLEGGGAAGGVAAGLSAFLNTSIQNGFQYVAEKTNLAEAIADADVIITGEGKLDHSSFNGKVIGEVISLAQMMEKEVIIICGSKDETLNLSTYPNVVDCFQVLDYEYDYAKAMLETKKLLEMISAGIVFKK